LCFQASLGKKVHETPSQLIAGCGGTCLSFQVILLITQEAEIRRITVLVQLEQKSSWDYHLNGKNSWVSTQNRRIKIQAALGKKVRSYLQNNQRNKGWSCGSSSRIPA
jgi:hypothetical protein